MRLKEGSEASADVPGASEDVSAAPEKVSEGSERSVLKGLKQGSEAFQGRL